MRFIPSGEYRLSSPLPPHGWRVLSVPPSTEPIPLAVFLSTALPDHPVTVVWNEAETSTWNAAIFKIGTETETATGSLPTPSRSFLERLPGARRPPNPPAVWSEGRGLPGAFVGDRPPRLPLVDYVAVAQLDQRGLLVETGSPRLYRFILGTTGETI